MTLSRDDVSKGLIAELDNMEQLLRSIDDDDWNKPSRCEGWTVAGVASHAVGGIADVVNGKLDGLGTPEATQREVDERAGGARPSSPTKSPRSASRQPTC